MTPLAGLATVVALAGAAPALAFDAAHPPAATALAPGVWLIPGEVPADREPDGNTVVFAAPDGLVVVDTGRHAWHTAAIADFARARGSPIAAIVNSHWHLDHTSGNPALRRAFPAARVFASGAIRAAQAGFLARSAAEDRQALAAGGLDPPIAEDLRGDLAAIAAGEALAPDVVIHRSRRTTIAGRRFWVGLEPNAATAGDVWILDPASGVAAVGDLVTLPVPFLDTACPRGWRSALADIARRRFATLVPGHGAPMTPAQFAAYRAAFAALIDCSASKAPAGDCAAGWVRDAAPLQAADGAPPRRIQAMAAYYVNDVLRAHGGRSRDCAAA